MITIAVSQHDDRARTIARAGDVESIGTGAEICTLARKLVSAGHDLAAPVEVTRAGRRVFAVAPLGAWAARTVSDATGTRLTTWRAHPQHGDMALDAILEPYRPRKKRQEVTL